jgi:hypothetical protein
MMPRPAAIVPELVIPPAMTALSKTRIAALAALIWPALDTAPPIVLLVMVTAVDSGASPIAPLALLVTAPLIVELLMKMQLIAAVLAMPGSDMPTKPFAPHGFTGRSAASADDLPPIRSAATELDASSKCRVLRPPPRRPRTALPRPPVRPSTLSNPRGCRASV